MTRRNRLLLLAALALALAAVLLVPACRWRVLGWMRAETFYRGRPTSYWRREILACPDPSWRPWFAFSPWLQPQQPASFVDELKRLLGLSYSRVSTDLPFSQNEPAAIPVLYELLKAADPKVRIYAAWRLGVLGPEGESAIPALTEALHDRGVWDYSPSSAVEEPAWLVRWRPSTWTVADEASSALEQIGLQAAAAVGSK